MYQSSLALMPKIDVPSAYFGELSDGSKTDPFPFPNPRGAIEFFQKKYRSHLTAVWANYKTPKIVYSA